MKYFFMVFIAILFSCQGNISNKYVTAYNYIKSDSVVQSTFKEELAEKNDFNIFVADSIVHILGIPFFDEIVEIKHGKIDNRNKKKELEIKEYLKRLKKSTKFKNYRKKELNRLNKSDDKDIILYFAECDTNGIMMAELFPYREDSFNKGIKELSMFNRSLMYLFKFKNEKIDTVFHSEVQYD